MDSLKLVKNLIKTKSVEKGQILKPGNLVIFKYNPKDTSVKYDRTPLCLVLRKSKSYTLGINFHWCPIPMRKMLLNAIFQLNKKNIKENKPLDIDWHRIKPMLKKFGFFPIIRLYINSRIYRRAVKIPNENMKQIIETKTETFIGVSAEALYKKALKDSKVSNKSKK
ncbi:hypothetical protein ACXG0S_001931 [Campylobacter coli]